MHIHSISVSHLETWLLISGTFRKADPFPDFHPHQKKNLNNIRTRSVYLFLSSSRGREAWPLCVLVIERRVCPVMLGSGGGRRKGEVANRRGGWLLAGGDFRSSNFDPWAKKTQLRHRESRGAISKAAAAVAAEHDRKKKSSWPRYYLLANWCHAVSIPHSQPPLGIAADHLFFFAF